MITFKTTVELPLSELRLTYKDTILMLGSCFAENIGNMLVAAKFRCDLNPYGVLYNPLSIATALTELLDGRRYGADDWEIFEHADLWHSYMHHSDFSSPERDDCLDRINRRLEQAAEAMTHPDVLLLTFGTAWVYRLVANGRVVGNCHKLPEQRFTRSLLDVDSMVSTYGCLIDRLCSINPSLKVILTVSPIRHVRDTMHGNQLSKSVLLLAVHRLCSDYACCHYFPSYEIQLDELRDYRFYADDLVHPSKLAVEYIRDCFRRCYFDEETLRIEQACKEIEQALNHRPFRPDSLQYKNFLIQTVLKINCLMEKYPTLDFQNELNLCHTRLHR